MKSYVALLRAVNVGGTGKLPMTTLVELCESAGFENVRTYIASGNVVLASRASEASVRASLEKALHAYANKAVGVIVRSAQEIADVAAHNPFAQHPGNRVAVLFTDDALPSDPLAAASGIADEEIAPGKRALYIHYPSGMGTSKLRVPSAKNGTARNINTVTKLAAMARGIGSVSG